jgi:hypothetical protein
VLILILGSTVLLFIILQFVIGKTVISIVFPIRQCSFILNDFGSAVSVYKGKVTALSSGVMYAHSPIVFMGKGLDPGI